MGVGTHYIYRGLVGWIYLDFGFLGWILGGIWVDEGDKKVGFAEKKNCACGGWRGRLRGSGH